MRRDDLTDAEWDRLARLLPGYGTPDDRNVINALLHQARTGARWRHLPARYGCWVTAYKRHRRWLADGTWQLLTVALKAEARDPDRVGSAGPPDPAFTRPQHAGSPGTPSPSSPEKDAAVLASLQSLLGDTVRPRGL